MQSSIKTSAGKNRVIQKKILPFISELYKPQNEKLEIKDSTGNLIAKYQQLKKLFKKNLSLKNHLLHD